jgi:hypothetical protein
MGADDIVYMWYIGIGGGEQEDKLKYPGESVKHVPGDRNATSSLHSLPSLDDRIASISYAMHMHTGEGS